MALLRYWYLFVILGLLTTLGYTSYSYEKELRELETNHLKIELRNSNNYSETLKVLIDSQQKLSDENARILEGIANDLNKTNAQFVTNNNRLVSLQQTLNTTKTNFDSYSKTALVNYTTGITDLFSTCGGMVVGVSKKADDATTAAIGYHKLLEANYKIIQEYNENIEKINNGNK